MIEYFKSVNNKYTYDNDKYLKNETPLMDEDGNSINDASFKLLIKKETSHFIHKNYGNIIVLAGAGASVVLMVIIYVRNLVKRYLCWQN